MSRRVRVAAVRMPSVRLPHGLYPSEVYALAEFWRDGESVAGAASSDYRTTTAAMTGAARRLREAMRRPLVRAPR